MGALQRRPLGGRALSTNVTIRDFDHWPARCHGWRSLPWFGGPNPLGHQGVFLQRTVRFQVRGGAASAAALSEHEVIREC